MAAVFSDGRVTGCLPASLAVISQGQVDHPLWLGQERYEWHPGEFRLAQLRAFPLRIVEPRTPGSQLAVYTAGAICKGSTQNVPGTASNCNYTGSGAWRRPHCNPSARGCCLRDSLGGTRWRGHPNSTPCSPSLW